MTAAEQRQRGEKAADLLIMASRDFAWAWSTWREMTSIRNLSQADDMVINQYNCRRWWWKCNFYYCVYLAVGVDEAGFRRFSVIDIIKARICQHGTSSKSTAEAFSFRKPNKYRRTIGHYRQKKAHSQLNMILAACLRLYWHHNVEYLSWRLASLSHWRPQRHQYIIITASTLCRRRWYNGKQRSRTSTKQHNLVSFIITIRQPATSIRYEVNKILFGYRRQNASSMLSALTSDHFHCGFFSSIDCQPIIWDD